MIRKIITFIIIFITAVLYGCSSGNETVSLKSTGWQIDSVIGLSIPPVGKNVTLDFSSDGKISGYGGCNKYGGSYKTTGGNISFANIYATEMFCDNMETEKTYLAALQKTDSYKISARKLRLYEGSNLLVILYEKP